MTELTASEFDTEVMGKYPCKSWGDPVALECVGCPRMRNVLPPQIATSQSCGSLRRTLLMGPIAAAVGEFTSRTDGYSMISGAALSLKTTVFHHSK